MLKVRLISPWTPELRCADAHFSREYTADEADALLCDWAPSSELFSFPRRKAWYCPEPLWQFRRLHQGRGIAIRRRLNPSEVLYHNHPDHAFRVPFATHIRPLTMNAITDRLDRAVAVVSNFGGSPLWRHSDLTLRNRFATNESVDLFGRRSWRGYRRNWFARPQCPPNYKGEVPGDWDAEEKCALLARYRVCVCLENICEPFWFTEKFVDAALAGCVPVYHAHPSLRDNVLRGAFWVDPADHEWDVEETMAVALKVSAAEVREQNRVWLSANEALADTHVNRVYSRIASCLRSVERQ